MKTIAGKQVHSIGIGTWNMGSRRDEQGEVIADLTQDESAIESLRYSLALGQNHIDTAELYGQGHTEELVGQVIHDIPRESLSVASKLWRTHYGRGQAVPAVQKTLERLQIQYLDLLYIHTPDSEVPMAEYMSEMDAVVAAGLTKAIGVSNFNLEQLKEAQSLTKNKIVALQNRYNVVYKEAMPSDLLDYCQEQGIAVVAYRPLERGKVAENEIVQKIAANHQATPAQVALAWLIQQENVMPIPKALHIEWVEDNFAASHLALAEEEIAQLDAI